LEPTSYGDSLYQTFSAYAGNSYLISLEVLIGKELLTEKEYGEADFGSDADDLVISIKFS